MYATDGISEQVEDPDLLYPQSELYAYAEMKQTLRRTCSDYSVGLRCVPPHSKAAVTLAVPRSAMVMVVALSDKTEIFMETAAPGTMTLRVIRIHFLTLTDVADANMPPPHSIATNRVTAWRLMATYGYRMMHQPAMQQVDADRPLRTQGAHQSDDCSSATDRQAP
ncbi:hypothetical protein PSPO01_15837 [Paraphaeosphaeria sporulosa]